MQAQIGAALATEARLRGIIGVLRDHPSVAVLAERVEAGIRSARAAAAVPREDRWAAEYWAALAADPAHGMGLSK